MLHTKSIKGETFELLMTLMQDERLSYFKLAGGTSLALYLGHRISIDFALLFLILVVYIFHNLFLL